MFTSINLYKSDHVDNKYFFFEHNLISFRLNLFGYNNMRECDILFH